MILCDARRSASAASFSSTKSETSVSPKVEVSPSDHGTLPLTSFVPEKGSNNDAMAVALDNRLVEKLRQAIGTTARPTLIQAHAIPLLLHGHDIMASSPTGSGKSIMFGLPLLQRLVLSQQQSNGGGNMGAPRALVISPTRELAAQTATVLKSFVVPRNSKSDSSKQNSSVVSLNVCLATGGSDLINQRQQLPSCDVLVGTPGRILQFSDERKLSLGSIEYLVVDEADRLLDMGFEPQLTRIARSLGRRKGGTSQQQSILCSATFPPGVQRLASDFLRPDYYFVSVGRVGSTHSNIQQRFEWTNAFYGNQRNRNNNNDGNNNRNFDPKEDAVVRNVQRFWEESKEAKTKQPNVIVFTNTKDGAEQYGKALAKLGNQFKTKNSKSSGSGAVRVIHGDK
jgi:superfamily II DNA/RNA helicase